MIPHDALVLDATYTPETAGSFARCVVRFRRFIGDRKEWVYADPEEVEFFGAEARAAIGAAKRMIEAVKIT